MTLQIATDGSRGSWSWENETLLVRDEPALAVPNRALNCIIIAVPQVDLTAIADPTTRNFPVPQGT